MSHKQYFYNNFVFQNHHLRLASEKRSLLVRRATQGPPIVSEHRTVGVVERGLERCLRVRKLRRFLEAKNDRESLLEMLLKFQPRTSNFKNDSKGFKV